jgi:hypothetical protein
MSQRHKLSQPYKSAGEIERVVQSFEACTCAAGAFKHREHLTVILWYLSKSGKHEATARMREGLYRFLDHHGVDRRKYHETITLFWVERVDALFAQATGERSLLETANKVLEVCGDAQLIFAYYSRELIDSDAARAGWVEPDLQSLDF